MAAGSITRLRLMNNLRPRTVTDSCTKRCLWSLTDDIVRSNQQIASQRHCASRYLYLNNYQFNNIYKQPYRCKSIFVSKHNDLWLSKDDIASYLNTRLGVSINNGGLRATNQHVILKECPFCTRPTKGRADNMFKLYIKIGHGAYFCHRCGAKGSWFDFKATFGGYKVGKFSESSIPSHRRSHSASNLGTFDSMDSEPQLNSSSPMPNERLAATYITNLLDINTGSSSKVALDYLVNIRGLTKAVLRKYGVGFASYNFPSPETGQYVPTGCITFPWIMRASEISEQESLKGQSFRWKSEIERENRLCASIPEIDENADNYEMTAEELEREKQTIELGPWMTRRIKARSLENKGSQRLDPPGGGWGFFGWHTVPATAKEIVITEGEYDAMAVYQATGRPSISLPNGCRSLPVEVLPLLERFDKIVLWCDNDGPGQEGAEKFARKLGLGRCFVVRLEGSDTPKDANDALRDGYDLEKLIQSAQVIPHKNILKFSELRSQVIHELCNPNEYKGAQIPSLPTLNKILKGYRRGELTVVSGPTGSGKTTFLSQLSLDFAENGVNCLWGSFEVKNTRLMLKLLRQFAREPLPSSEELQEPGNIAKDVLESIADRFESLPLYFMRFHGGSEVDDIVDAMQYAVYVHDVEHIILDNLQFMLSRKFGKGSFDKFDVQDFALEVFRKFATEHNVHVTLVVHPRKEDEGSRLGMSSIYGTAKATQEADNVLIVQSDGRRKFLEVKKNRYDGTLGFCPLHFHFQSGRYEEHAEMGSIPDESFNSKNFSNSIGMGKDVKKRNEKRESDNEILQKLGHLGIDDLFTGGKPRSHSSMSSAKYHLYNRRSSRNTNDNGSRNNNISTDISDDKNIAKANCVRFSEARSKS